VALRWQDAQLYDAARKHFAAIAIFIGFHILMLPPGYMIFATPAMPICLAPSIIAATRS
jgi:hypothetical protein